MSPYVQYIMGYMDRARKVEDKRPMFPDQLGRNGDMTAYLLTLTPVQQLRFAVDQAICVSYLAWLYGPRASEFFITYSEWLKWFITSTLASRKFDSMYQELYEDVLKIVDSWLGGHWDDVNIGTIKVLVYDPLVQDFDLPMALSKDAAIPYLMYRNKHVQPGFDTWKAFEIPGSITVTIYGCCYIMPRRVGNGFAATVVDSDNQVSAARTGWIRNGFPILDLLYHANLQGTGFEEMLSLLAYLKQSDDPYREYSRNHSLFYVTNKVLNAMFSTDFLDVTRYGYAFPLDKPAIKADGVSGVARVLMTFLAAINKRYGVVMHSREMFVRFFGTIVDKRSDEEKVVEYVESTGSDKVASAESLYAFEHHMLGSCEAIDLISQTPDMKGVRAETAEEEPEDDDDANFNLDDIPGIDEAEPGLEAEDDSADADTSTDTDESSDDPSAGPGDPPDDEGAQNAGEDETQGGNSDTGSEGSGDPNEQPTDGNSTQPNVEPENLNDSDDDGIPFSVIPDGSETVGSVLFREELDQFLTDTLSNPPKKLSPQAVSALTTLQRNWLHILSVETIVRIIGKLIALPERFKQIPN